jgi:hypothetical protein
MKGTQSRIPITILLGCAFASFCCLATPLRADESAPRYSVGGSVWHSQGSLEFELGNDEWGTWSRVKWPLTGLLGGIEAAVDWPLPENVALVMNARYGRSFALEGSSRDWDWRPWVERSEVSDYSETDTSGTLQTLDVRAGLRFPTASAVDFLILAGYRLSSFDLDDTDLMGFYDYGITPASSPGLVDTYSVDFSGFCLGGSLVARAGDRLTLSAEIETFLNLSVDADADWIQQGHPFRQNASGTGLTASGKAGYAIRPNLTLTAGMEWTSWTAEDGRQRGILDGLPYDADVVRKISLEYVTVEMGIVIGL